MVIPTPIKKRSKICLPMSSPLGLLNLKRAPATAGNSAVSGALASLSAS